MVACVLSAAESADKLKGQRLARPRHIFHGAVFLHFRDCAGVAGNALRLSIISLLVAVRYQLDVLIIVEVEHVLLSANRERRFLTRHKRVARNIRFRIHDLAISRGSGLGLNRILVIPVPVVVHRVAQVGSRLEYRFELRLLIQTIIRLIQIRSGHFIRQSRTRAFNRLFGGNPDPAIKFISVFRVGRYGRQLIADDRTVFSHNLARHDLHMLRSFLDSGATPKCAVTVRRVNNFGALFRVRYELRRERRGRIQIAVFIQLRLGRFRCQGQVVCYKFVAVIPSIELVTGIRQSRRAGQAGSIRLQDCIACMGNRAIFRRISNRGRLFFVRLKPRYKNRVLIQVCLLVPVQFRLGQFRCELRVAGYPFIGLLSGYLVPANELISRVRRGHRAGDRLAAFQLSGRLQNGLIYGWINSAVAYLLLVNRAENRSRLVFVRHELRGIRRISRHRIRNLRLPASKRPAGFACCFAVKRGGGIAMFRVVFLGLKRTVLARFIRYRVANFLIIDLNNVLAFIRLNRQREVFHPIKLITIFRLLRVRVDLRSAHLSFADYGCIFVFYVVVVIFNRIPIRAAIIDIERVINLLQFERSIRISDNFVTAIKLFWR